MAGQSVPMSQVPVLEEALEDSLQDSFIVVAQTEAQTIGSTFERLTGFVLGPQNFDIAEGPDVSLADDADALNILSAGRYSLNLNCQIVSAEVPGWFEPAVEPNGLDLSSELWPGDITVGHVGIYVPQEVFGWDVPPTPGADAGYVSPRLAVGATVAAWAKFSSSDGLGTCDVRAILYATRITA